MTKNKLLTKSKYLAGLQCPKYLWFLYNEPAKIPEPASAVQFRFDQGKMVGELAKELFPDGINIPVEDFSNNIEQTKNLLSQQKPLFEAGILAKNLYSRIDILNPVDNGLWDIIEVKSSTKVKDEHVFDVAFQKHCCELAGIKIRNCFLLHINNAYVKQGDINPQELFTQEDITEQVSTVLPNIDAQIANIFESIQTPECPEVGISKNCSTPYNCQLKDYCWGFLPASNVFDLYRGGKKSWELFNQDILAIKDIPSNFKLSEKQKIQKSCDVSDSPYVNKTGLRQFLDRLESPLYYLDFETFSPAIPLFDGMKPYQRVPFQFSLHVVTDNSIKHHSFLAQDSNDPRPEFLSALKESLGDSGSIVVYNQVFEKGVLEELAQAFPEYREFVDSVFTRIVDLLMPFRNFDYYHPLQKGSASIKYVLPVLTGASYSEMDIGNGEDASIAFMNITFGDVSEEERQKVRSDLEKYCLLDTEGMIWIVSKVRELSSERSG